MWHIPPRSFTDWWIRGEQPNNEKAKLECHFINDLSFKNFPKSLGKIKLSRFCSSPVPFFSAFLLVLINQSEILSGHLSSRPLHCRPNSHKVLPCWFLIMMWNPRKWQISWFIVLKEKMIYYCDFQSLILGTGFKMMRKAGSCTETD